MALDPATVNLTAGTNTLFYYHSDHVQSTSYMTGGDGSILQHDEYLPSGEVWLWARILPTASSIGTGPNFIVFISPQRARRAQRIEDRG